MAKKKQIINGKIECSECNIWKDFTTDNFYLNKNGTMKSKCIECQILASKIYRETHKLTEEQRNKKIKTSKEWNDKNRKKKDPSEKKKPGKKPTTIIDGKACCTKCNEWKVQNEENFCMRKSGKNAGKFLQTCRECQAEYAREYRKTHPKSQEQKEKDIQSLIQWKTSNKERAIESQKQWKIDNRDKINEKYNNRIKNDISFKLRKLISRSILFALKKQDSSKNNKSILEFLPYTIDELKIHLESQFYEWMTWNNHGVYNLKTWDDKDQSTWVWNIDHIIPQSDLPYTSMEDENFKNAGH
jgi:hypothetical protein